MPAFTDLVRRLLEEGRVILSEPPHMHAEERLATLELLTRAFTDRSLDVAGPPIDFAPEIALRATELLTVSCWFLLHRREAPEEVLRGLPTLPRPRSASEHLSGDLLLSYLPQVHRRAQSVDPQDPLTVRLRETLRLWPLSGVLTDLDEPPLHEVDLDGHPGLLLLYAERLIYQPRPTWLPGAAGMAYVELVFNERRLPVPSAERSLS